MKINFQSIKKIDWLLYILPILFAILGIAIIYSLTYYSNVKLFYNQIVFAIIGVVLMIVFSFIDYRYIRSISWILYAFGIGTLILVFILGKTSFGSTRWIDLGFFDFQPSELFKIILAICLANYYAGKVGKINLRDIGIGFVITIIPVILVMLQPDLGTAIMFILIYIACLLACKLNFRQIISFMMLAIVSLPIGWFVMKDYQRQRIMTFINPTSDPFGSGYNVTQSLITVGSGGLWGKGFGHGTQSQFNFLPVAHTDFVFAGIAEATGFVGSVVLLILFSILILKIVSISKVSRDNFGSIFSLCVAAIIIAQIIVNVGMNIGLMPVTGIPLPFISSGGSALVIMFIAIGIIQSIYIRHQKVSFR